MTTLAPLTNGYPESGSSPAVCNGPVLAAVQEVAEKDDVFMNGGTTRESAISEVGKHLRGKNGFVVREETVVSPLTGGRAIRAECCLGK